MAIKDILNDLATRVDTAIHKGDFWLSTDKPSDYWIYLDELNDDSFIKPLEEVFKVFFEQFFAEHEGQWFIVFVHEQLSEATELSRLKNAIEVGRLNLDSETQKRVHKPLLIGLEKYSVTGTDEVEELFEGSNCLIVVSLSLHLDMIARLKDTLEQHKANVTHVFALIEREGFSRIHLEESGIDLISALVWEQDPEELTVSSLLENTSMRKYHGYFEEAGYIELDHLISRIDEDNLEESSKLRQKLADLKDKLEEELYEKAVKIIRGIDALYAEHDNSFRLKDTEIIQRWVREHLTKEDFKRIAKVAFGQWANPERLLGDGVPHINKANDKMGEFISVESEGQNLKVLRILDLGSGALGTVKRVIDKLAENNIFAILDAVEFTPELLEYAYREKVKIENSNSGFNIAIHNNEMLAYVKAAPSEIYNFITISYAIHHLHPEEQTELMRQLYRVLRPGGSCLIADPQEGKSVFNRETLLREEPEGVFAIFSSPDESKQNLLDAGFDIADILLRDDDGFTGFLVFATKKK